MYQAPRLDPGEALRLAEQGGAILLLGVPEGTAVGIDHKGQTFVVGPRFKGVKMVPPGAHLVSYNACGAGGDFAPTVSFFAHVAARSVLVRRWSPSEELLVALPEDEERAYAQGARAMAFDAGLAPYDLASAAAWHSLASFISARVIDKLSPLGGASLCVTAEPDPRAGPGVAKTPGEQRLEEQLAGSGARAQADAAPGRTVAAAGSGVGRCFYTRVPNHIRGGGVVGRALTDLNRDKSAALEALLQRTSAEPEDLVGELQFAFLAFLLGHSLEGFAQWKALLGLALACRALPRTPAHAPLFTALVTALTAQLALALGAPGASGVEPPQSPLGLPVMEELLGDSFLRRLLEDFIADICAGAPPAPADLQVATEGLRGLLQARLGWALAAPPGTPGGPPLVEHEDEDEAPTVADVSELGYAPGTVG